VSKSDRPLRLAFNGVPLLSPLTGIGQYSNSLLQGLDARADVSSLKFYGKGWSPEIRKPGLSVAAARGWKEVIRKWVPNAYDISRWGSSCGSARVYKSSSQTFTMSRIFWRIGSMARRSSRFTTCRGFGIQKRTR